MQQLLQSVIHEPYKLTCQHLNIKEKSTKGLQIMCKRNGNLSIFLLVVEVTPIIFIIFVENTYYM